MHQAQPLTIGSNLLTTIERLGTTDDPLPSFELARLKREAAKLLKANAQEAYVVQAGLAALEWDAAAVLDNTNKALRLGATVTTYLNCALSLRLVGNTAGAVQLVTEAVQRYPADMEVQKLAVEVLISAGRLHEAAKICQAMIDRSLPHADFIDGTLFLAAQADKLGITDETMSAQAGFARDVLTAHRRRIHGYTVRVSSDPDGSEMLVFSIQFIGTPLDEMRLESELASKLADLPDWDPCVFVMELLATPLQHADLSV
ncbi:MAG: hypothetical protein RLZZ352_2724 [Pseudomonadota bacterium]